ncbi:MAG: class I SAM-dependent methyltransferase [Candidatus Micrarchaeaceae archaeon]
MTNMESDKGANGVPFHRFPALYKLSPTLYGFGHRILRAVRIAGNMLFVVKNYRYIKRIKTSKLIESEYKEELAELERITKDTHLRYPKYWAIDESSGLVVYSLIRSLKPDTVLETGVANGFSTRLILNALNRNGKGRLTSVEISRDVGQLLKGVDKSRWRLVVGKPRENLKTALKGLGKIDVFIHDSDHSYGNMLFEFNSVIGKMSRDGVIVSDDVSRNRAFLEFAAKIGRRPLIYASSKKAFGVIELG